VDGPGVLITWTFTALACTEPDLPTPLLFDSDPDRMFADAGLWVWPGHPTFPRQVVAADTALVVCVPLGADPSASAVSTPTRVWPNPWRGPGPATLSLGDLGRGPGRVTLYAVNGRRLWETAVAADAGTLRLPWLPAGVYLCQATRGESHHTGRFTRLR
jgi:hypothetical protein